ncbi:MAG TPA: family 65 glycosyl hydrolase, partial [Firmicutes bacterium]|nr:family 65 glycosyl hydrolase [Bacillota bacterium]
NYGEDFWQGVTESSRPDLQLVTMKTKKSGFVVAAASSFRLYLNGDEVASLKPTYHISPRYASGEVAALLQIGETLSLEKTVAVATNRDYPSDKVTDKAAWILKQHPARYDELFAGHARAWSKVWQDSDIQISGDVAAQQGIRFNIF